MAMEAEVPGIGDVGWYAEKQCRRCCKRKRKPQPSLVTPGALQVLPQEEEKERSFARRFITFCLSKVSKETDEKYMDSVNACDPSKVAAQLEAVLFENWGFNDQTLESTKKYSAVFSWLHNPAIKDFRRQVLLGEISPEQLVNMSKDELHRKYPLEDLCANCCRYAEKQCPRCGKRKRKTMKPLENRQPSLVTPGALQVLPREEEKERAFARRFITFCLSKVSKETDEKYMDSVNACDPSKVAAQLEAVLFENWGFNDQTLLSTRKYSTVFSYLHTPAMKDFRRQVLLGEISPQVLVNMSGDQLRRKYPLSSYLDDLCENCCRYEECIVKLGNFGVECDMKRPVTLQPLGTKLLMQKEHLPLGLEPRGTSVLEVLPREEEKERSFARRFITFCLSKVSKETDEKYVDSVNACDPSKVAAQLEAVLFENWGFNDQTLLSTRKYSAVFSCLHRSAIKDFRRQVLLGEISPKQLVSMSPDEVYEMCKPRSDDTQRCITRFH